MPEEFISVLAEEFFSRVFQNNSGGKKKSLDLLQKDKQSRFVMTARNHAKRKRSLTEEEILKELDKKDFDIDTISAKALANFCQKQELEPRSCRAECVKSINEKKEDIINEPGKHCNSSLFKTTIF